MKNRQNRAAGYYRLTGTWMEDGCVHYALARYCDVQKVGDTLYQVDDHGERRCRLSVDRSGNLCGWGPGVEFAPDAGELARIGLGTGAGA